MAFFLLVLTTMKLYFNNYLLLVALFLVGNVAVFAQTDLSTSNRKKIATPPTTKKVKNTSVSLYGTNKVNTAAIDNSLNKNKPKPKQNILLETKPEDRDIIGKKYWKGKDVTHQKIRAAINLGTVYSSSKTVVVECRDYSYVDGDRIEILVNEKPVSSNIGLRGNYYRLLLTLEKGYNRIDFRALNQGLSGPNTAELKVYDEQGSLLSAKEWSMLTGEVATIGIIKKE